jgi:hypothetical protein
MKVLLLGESAWQGYDVELLHHDQGYKFVAWIGLSQEDVIIVFPIQRYKLEMYHRNGVSIARADGVSDQISCEPNGFGAISVSVNKNEKERFKRIVQWRSLTYGTTPEKIRPNIRDALQLSDMFT